MQRATPAQSAFPFNAVHADGAAVGVHAPVGEVGCGPGVGVGVGVGVGAGAAVVEGAGALVVVFSSLSLSLSSVFRRSTTSSTGAAEQAIRPAIIEAATQRRASMPT